jgi:hypothetical protein
MIEEIAPDPGSWTEHLGDLADRDIVALAKDYRWLDEEARPRDAREEFRRRREAVLAECERRGLEDAARECRGVQRAG